MTRISLRYLEAIEDEDYESLPGTFFCRSFIRQYADALGLAEEELEDDLNQTFDVQDSPPIPGQEPPRPGSDLPPIPSIAEGTKGERRLPWAVALFVAAVAAGSGLYSLWEKPGTEAAALPRSSQAAPPMASPIPPQETALQQTAAVESPTPAESDPEPDSRPVVTSHGGGDLKVELAAREKTWLSVTANEKLLFTGILDVGEARIFEGLKNVRILVGNAGGLEVSWNGNPVGALGRSGQVRVVSITSQGAKILSPAAQPDSVPVS